MKIIKTCLLITCLLGFGISKGQGWFKFYTGEGDLQEENFSMNLAHAALTPDGGLMLAASHYFDIRIENNTFVVTGTTSTNLLHIDSRGNLIDEKIWEGFIAGEIINASSGGYYLAGGTQSNPDLYAPHGITLSRADEFGNLLWVSTIDIDSSIANEVFPKIVETADGNIAMVALMSTYLGQNNRLGFVCIDSTGNVISRKLINRSLSPLAIFENTDGTFLIGSTSGETSALLKIDSEGNEIWSKTYGESTMFSVGTPRNGFASTDDGGTVMIRNSRDSTANALTGTWACKTDSDGNIVWEKVFLQQDIHLISLGIGKVTGGFILVGFKAESPLVDNATLLKIDDNGNELWFKTAGSIYMEEASGVLEREDGSLFLYGGGGPRPTTGRDVWSMRADSLGNVFSNQLNGRVVIDENENCEIDIDEIDLEGWLVQINGELSHTASTDSSGYYSLPLDTGEYVVELIAGPYWDVCNNPVSLNLASSFDTATIDFPVKIEEECPLLNVSMTTGFLRRCFDNTYTVQYCNDGTITAENAYVEITLDTFLTYQSSTIPLSTQNGNTLTFDLGSVPVNECGSFEIKAHLSCFSTWLGQTHCSEAHIFPDSLCLPLSSLWDGSSVEIDVECIGDSVIFTIQNTGTGNMSEPLNYIIIEDQIVLLESDFQLDAGQTISIPVFANGSTLHLEAEQSPEHPTGITSTGATIEGCGGWFGISFFTQYTTPDASPFVDIDCQENVGSFDPNDKQAFPVGFGDDHLIEPETDIEYLIRFQNTGTDTAFKVVIVDVLPEELDLTTLRPGASSHSYKYSVSPEGWPTFTFDDLMLPDSNANEAASHGFVRFKVSQQKGNGNGTYIENTALIYFDFNTPVQTNTVLHKVGEIFPWTLVDAEEVQRTSPQIRIMPNPLNDKALLQLENTQPGHLHLLLTNSQGQVLRDETMFGTGFEFYRDELPSGIYFFKIEKDGVYVGSGKLMVR